jgi:chitodextrinase
VTVTNPTFDGATIAWTVGEEGQSNFELHITAAGVDTLVATTSDPVTVTGLPSATAYTVTVRAICGEGDYSEWSAPATFSTATCQMVEGVRASATTATTATITWTANGSSSYEVAYGITGTSRENCTRLTANTNSITINGLAEATTYDVYVRSVCAAGVTSDWSDVVTFETQDVAIDDVDNASISLYPNPASSTVTLTGIEGDATVTVVDMNGRESGKWKVESGKLTIDVTGYAQGAYFVRITGERVNAIRKLIVK